MKLIILVTIITSIANADLISWNRKTNHYLRFSKQQNQLHQRESSMLSNKLSVAYFDHYLKMGMKRNEIIFLKKLLNDAILEPSRITK